MNRSVLAMVATLAVTAAGCGNGHAMAPAAGGSAAGGRTHVYYIAADEVVWDYAPTGTNQIEGRPFNDVEKVFMEPGKHAPGRKEMKALYREYTDSSFTTLKPRTAEWAHLGFLGPLIRAEVGDTISIVFHNNARFKASLHPHGVFYNKDSEGALYNDGTSGVDKLDDGVPQGETHTYVWQVPERAGPAEHDGSSVLWMYHSHIDEIRDVASGLVGPMIVTRKGSARADGSPTDVDREFVAGFMEVDENQSWYVEDNVKTYTTDPKGVKMGVGDPGKSSPSPTSTPGSRKRSMGFHSDTRRALR